MYPQVLIRIGMGHLPIQYETPSVPGCFTLKRLVDENLYFRNLKMRKSES